MPWAGWPAGNASPGAITARQQVGHTDARGDVDQGIGRRLAARADHHGLDAVVQHIDVIDHDRVGERVLVDIGRERRRYRFGPVPIGRLAGQVIEPGQHADHGAVAGRRGIVDRRLGPDDQRFGIVGGEEVAAIRVIPITFIGNRAPGRRPIQITRLAGDFVQRQRGTRPSPA